MSDPHVDSLQYLIRHSEGVDYSAAPPVEYEHSSFKARIEGCKTTITMSEHFATVEAARNFVEPHLRAWELKLVRV
jgi:hypothetical protein